MAMPKARGEVTEYDPSDDSVMLVGPGCPAGFEDGYWVTVAQLNRAELMKAAAYRCPNGGKLTSHDNATLRQIIKSGQAPTVDAAVAQADAFTLTQESEAQPLTTMVGTATKAPTNQAAAEKLAEALALFSPEAPAVDMAEVQRLVMAAAEASETRLTAQVDQSLATLSGLVATLAPHVTEVTVVGAEPVTIEGRQHERMPELLALMGLREHTMLVGPAGTGKSTMVHTAAVALGMKFESMSVGPTTPESRLFGYKDANGAYHDTGFRRCFEDGGVFLLDEIDNGHPGILAGLNQALANGSCGFPDGMVTRHPDFLVIATANTYGTGATAQYVGRNVIDAATLDRFTMVEIPTDLKVESDIVKAICPEHADKLLADVKRYRKNIDKAGLRVLVTMRGSIAAARMLAAGMDYERVTATRLLRGLPPEQLSKVTA